MDCLFHQPRPDKIGIGNHFKRRLLERQDGVGSSRRKIRSQPGTVVLKHLQVLAHLSAGWAFGVRHDLRRRMPRTDREWHVYKKGVAPAPNQGRATPFRSTTAMPSSHHRVRDRRSGLRKGNHVRAGSDATWMDSSVDWRTSTSRNYSRRPASRRHRCLAEGRKTGSRRNGRRTVEAKNGIGHSNNREN